MSIPSKIPRNLPHLQVSTREANKIKIDITFRGILPYYDLEDLTAPPVPHLIISKALSYNKQESVDIDTVRAFLITSGIHIVEDMLGVVVSYHSLEYIRHCKNTRKVFRTLWAEVDAKRIKTLHEPKPYSSTKVLLVFPSNLLAEPYKKIRTIVDSHGAIYQFNCDGLLQLFGIPDYRIFRKISKISKNIDLSKDEHKTAKAGLKRRLKFLLPWTHLSENIYTSCNTNSLETLYPTGDTFAGFKEYNRTFSIINNI